MGALLRQLLLGHTRIAAVDLLFAEQGAIQIDVPCARRFHVVDAAQHGRLAAAARPDDRGLVAPLQGRVDPL